jgi:hypothetical protein
MPGATLVIVWGLIENWSLMIANFSTAPWRGGLPPAVEEVQEDRAGDDAEDADGDGKPEGHHCRITQGPKDPITKRKFILARAD